MIELSPEEVDLLFAIVRGEDKGFSEETKTKLLRVMQEGFVSLMTLKIDKPTKVRRIRNIKVAG